MRACNIAADFSFVMEGNRIQSARVKTNDFFTLWPSWHNHTGAGGRFSYCADPKISFSTYLDELKRPETHFSVFAITEHAYSMVSPVSNEAWPSVWFDKPEILEKNKDFIINKMTLLLEEGKKYRDGVHVFQGLEVELDSRGKPAVPEEMIWKMDVVIGSVHFNPGPEEDWIERHFERLNALARFPFDIIGHPVRHLGSHSTRENPLPEHVISGTLDILEKNGIALEVNSHVMQIQDDSRLLSGAVERKVPVAFSLDMHTPDEFDKWTYFKNVVEESKVNPADIILFKPDSRRHG